MRALFSAGGGDHAIKLIRRRLERAALELTPTKHVGGVQRQAAIGRSRNNGVIPRGGVVATRREMQLGTSEVRLTYVRTRRIVPDQFVEINDAIHATTRKVMRLGSLI